MEPQTIFNIMTDKFRINELQGSFSKFYENLPNDCPTIKECECSTHKKLKTIENMNKYGITLSEMLNFGNSVINEFNDLTNKHQNNSKEIFNTNNIIEYYFNQTNKIYRLGFFSDLISNMIENPIPNDVLLNIIQNKTNFDVTKGQEIINIVENIVECKIMMMKYDREIIKLRRDNSELLWIIQQKINGNRVNL